MNFGNVLTVSRWELRRSRGRFSVGVLLPAVLLTASMMVLLLLYLTSPSPAPLYSAGVLREDRVLLQAMEYDGRFRVVEAGGDAREMLTEGELDLLLTSSPEGTLVLYAPTDKSLAALSALEEAVKLYKTLTLFAVEGEQVNYAFPLWIQTHQLKRSVEFQYFALPGDEGESPRREGGGGGPGVLVEEESAPEALPRSQVAELLEDYRRGLRIDTSGIRTEEARITLPALFSPPLPFTSVLLAFIIALPIYLSSQFYATSMLEERNLRRAEVLLASPLSAWEVVAGKTLAHLLLALGGVAAVALVLRRKLEAEVLLVFLPVVLLFLSVSLLASVLSRSYRENSFILIFTSVAMFSFLFFPAMFVNVHAVSGISPVSLLVDVFEGGEITPGEYLLSTMPLTLAAGVLFVLASGIFAGEVHLCQRGTGDRVLYGINLLWRRAGGTPAAALLLGAAAAAVAYLLELGYIVALFQLPLPQSLYGLIALGAYTEELLKALVVAGIVRYSRLRPGMVLIAGAVCGAGFFLGEKLIALSTLAQLSGSLFWQALMEGRGLLLALLLQVSLTLLTAAGLVLSGGRLRGRFIPALVLAGGHLLYNLRQVGGVL
ncbi:MAG: ABC transporter permease [Euryarchaeota archaeon]|nr:ABC transporter permease [Euryarchaeota archaeon]